MPAPDARMCPAPIAASVPRELSEMVTRNKVAHSLDNAINMTIVQIV